MPVLKRWKLLQLPSLSLVGLFAECSKLIALNYYNFQTSVPSCCVVKEEIFWKQLEIRIFVYIMVAAKQHFCNNVRGSIKSLER